MFKDCRDEKVQSDVLQETSVFFSPSLSVTDALSDSFINTAVGGLIFCCFPQADQSIFRLALGEQPKVS